MCQKKETLTIKRMYFDTLSLCQFPRHVSLDKHGCTIMFFPSCLIIRVRTLMNLRQGSSFLSFTHQCQREQRDERMTFNNILFVVALSVDKEFVIYFIFKKSIKQLNDFTIIYLFLDIKFQCVLFTFCTYCNKREELRERLKNAAHE